MLEYITKEEYVKILGTSVPDDFKKLVIQASSYINKECSGRIDKVNISEKIKYTTCLIIDCLKEKKDKISEINNLKSENIEGWSKTYDDPKEIEKYYLETMNDILKENLWDEIGNDGKPLLYKGVC